MSLTASLLLLLPLLLLLSQPLLGNIGDLSVRAQPSLVVSRLSRARCHSIMAAVNRCDQAANSADFVCDHDLAAVARHCDAAFARLGKRCSAAEHVVTSRCLHRHGRLTGPCGRDLDRLTAACKASSDQLVRNCHLQYRLADTTCYRSLRVLGMKCSRIYAYEKESCNTEMADNSWHSSDDSAQVRLSERRLHLERIMAIANIKSLSRKYPMKRAEQELEELLTQYERNSDIFLSA